MKISSVRCYFLSYAFPEPPRLTYYGGDRIIVKRDAMLIRVGLGYSAPSRAGMYPFPLASEILKEPLDIDHGDLMVPKAPGPGVEVGECVIERYPWIIGPWSHFQIDSPIRVRSVGGDHGEQWYGQRPRETGQRV